MLTEALRRLSSRAGPPFPAQPRTLQHLLIEASRPTAAHDDVVAAIEFDPAILANYLVLMPTPRALATWHDGWNVDALRTVALALAGLAVSDSTGQPPAHEQAWARAVKRGALAAELASHLQVDPITARLTAMFAEAGAWHADETAEPADALKHMGVPPAICDAVRYCRAAPQALAGSTLLVRLTAATHRLVETVEGNAVPTEPDHLALSSELVEASLAASSQSFLLAVARLPPPRPLGALIADTATGHFAYRSLSRSGAALLDGQIALLAKLLLGAPGAYLFQRKGDALQAELSPGEYITVPADHPESPLADVCSGLATRTLVPQDLVLIAEQQLLTALDTPRLVVGSLGASGILAIGWPHEQDPDPSALSALLAAARDALAGNDDDRAVAEQTRVRQAVHEANNPLAVIRNYLEVLSDRMSGDEAADEISAITQELARVHEILKRLAEGETAAVTPVVPVATDVNGLVRELAGLVAKGAKQVRFKGRLDPALGVVLLAPDALRQVLLILLRNAIEAVSAASAPAISVTTTAAINVDGISYLAVTITDNGPGMTAEQRLALFQAEGISTKGANRGLGLPIALQLIASMDGHISCMPVPGKPGARFQLLLPHIPGHGQSN